MKLDDELVMSLPRRHVEQIILGLYDQINLHLVKLVAFEFPAELRQHFRRELRGWLTKIQRLRMKPDHRPGSFKFYYDLLYDGPFGGVEIDNMRSMIDLIAVDYDRSATKTAAEIIEWLRAFHTQLAERLQNGEDVLDLIPE